MLKKLVCSDSSFKKEVGDLKSFFGNPPCQSRLSRTNICLRKCFAGKTMRRRNFHGVYCSPLGQFDREGKLVNSNSVFVVSFVRVLTSSSKFVLVFIVFRQLASG